MRKVSRMTWRAAVLVVLFAGLKSIAAVRTVGILHDEGGAVFNVRAYGALGDGTTNDQPAIQQAITAALTAGGGVVYFPAGTYLITSTLTNGRGDIVSLAGAGMGSVLQINTPIGVSYPSFSSQVTQFHNATITHMKLACQSTTDIAVQMTDLVTAPSLADLTVSKCNVGFDLVNIRYWTERLVATNIADHYNNHLFHFDQNPADTANSYGYGTYSDIYINKSAGQDVFFLTGGAYLYHSTFIIKGNFDVPAPDASIFNVQGAKGQACPGAAINLYDIAVEGAGYSVVKSANNGCRDGAAGNAIVEGSGSISATGAAAVSNGLIRTIGHVPYLVGMLTTTTSAYDTLKSSPTLTPSSKCYVQPDNAVAAAMVTGTYVSATDYGSLIVTHPARAGGVFQAWCAPQ